MGKAKSNKLPTEILGGIFRKDFDVLRDLVSPEALKCVDRHGRSVLINGVIENYPELVVMALRFGADVNLRDKQGWSALHFAAQGNSLAMVEILVDHGGDVNLKDARGCSVLFRAVYASRGNGDVIRALLRASADPDAENGSGISARKLAFTIANYDVRQFFEGG